MRKILCALAALLLVPALSCAQALYSIAEIREQVEQVGRWTETYEVNGRTVEVDVPIEVPQVDALPVLRIADGQITADETREDLPEGVQGIVAYGTAVDGGMPYLSSFGGPDAWICAWEKRTYAAKLDMDATLSGDIGLSANDLLCMMEGLVADCYGYEAALYPEYVSEETEWREYDSRVGGWGDVVEVEPVIEASADAASGRTAKGLDAYTLSCFEMVRGVPILSGMLYLHDGGTSDWNREGPASANPIKMQYTSEGFILFYSGYEVSDVAAEDVPLCGFDVAKAQFERLIERGNLRSVNAVRLGYVVCLDPKGGERWLVPMWVVDGRFTRHAGQKDNPLEYAMTIEEYQRQQIGVNAQTGKLVEPTDDGRKRCNAPEIITWEEAGR